VKKKFYCETEKEKEGNNQCLQEIIKLFIDPFIKYSPILAKKEGWNLIGCCEHLSGCPKSNPVLSAGCSLNMLKNPV